MPARTIDRAWVAEATARIDADFTRSADTHLLRLELEAFPGLRLYIKDESTHPTGSLKHRLARSLILFGICSGWIGPETHLVEASSGSTAVSEAYFARLLGLRFTAVVPRSTSPEKLAAIAFYGGGVEMVERVGDVYAAARELADATGGHYVDQFTYSERATDWRGNNNIAESIFEQLSAEPDPIPRWIVVGAGTGGTSATIGRYLRYRGLPTRLCVVDPEGSVFAEHWRSGDPSLRSEQGSRIEGIGRPRVEPSFVPQVVDRMIEVPDLASFAACRVLARLLGRSCGPSSGTNFTGALELLCELRATGARGSVVTMLCDAGERYRATWLNDDWLAAQGFDVGPAVERIERIVGSGRWEA